VEKGKGGKGGEDQGGQRRRVSGVKVRRLNRTKHELMTDGGDGLTRPFAPRPKLGKRKLAKKAMPKS